MPNAYGIYHRQRWIAGKSRWRGFHSLSRGLKEGPSRSVFGITSVGTELLMGEQGEGSRVTAGGGSGAEPPVGQGESLVTTLILPTVFLSY